MVATPVNSSSMRIPVVAGSPNRTRAPLAPPGMPSLAHLGNKNDASKAATSTNASDSDVAGESSKGATSTSAVGKMVQEYWRKEEQRETREHQRQSNLFRQK
ncbi:unnamed protein product [Amoebophrya sp. A25]|nr:unnamed protein product [Amoebophrya sp. A25]|eukprot:GSA25T00010876001.1